MKGIYVVIGFGHRGKIYADYLHENFPDKLEAVVDSSDEKIAQAKKLYGDSVKYYLSLEEYLAAGGKATVAIVATQDNSHAEIAIKCMSKGMDILLEKPIASTLRDCENIYNYSVSFGRRVLVCHVLRYSHFYNELKKLIDANAIGRILSIRQCEHVGYWHFAHSYVRGEWSCKETSSPIILAKSCHDMDIIAYLMKDKIKEVSSYGDLYLFKEENAPKNSTLYCQDCPYNRDCAFDAYSFYKDKEWWSRYFLKGEFTDENLRKSLRESNYGKCVYHSANDVCDNMVVNIKMESGRIAQFQMTAFSKECYRNIEVFGSAGDICGNFETKIIKVSPFKGEPYTIDLTKKYTDFSFHGGGDNVLMGAAIRYFEDGVCGDYITTIQESMNSHRSAFMAEESRLTNKAVCVKQ